MTAAFGSLEILQEKSRQFIGHFGNGFKLLMQVISSVFAPNTEATICVTLINKTNTFRNYFLYLNVHQLSFRKSFEYLLWGYQMKLNDRRRSDVPQISGRVV